MSTFSLRSEKKDTILLCYPQTMHEKNYRHFYLPYSVLSVASMINRERFRIIIIDNNLEKYDDFNRFISDLQDNLLCVGISSMIGHQIRDGFKIAESIRQVNSAIPIVWGGALPTLLPEQTIAHHLVDIVVRGMGQAIFSEVVECLAQNESLEGIAGIYFKHDGKILKNTEREPTQISAFPPFRSVYNLLDVRRYIKFDEHINSRTLNYHSSQGCPFNCGFCCEPVLWQNKWSAFPASKVLDDIEFLILNYGINGVKFNDAEFFVSKERVLNFARGVIERRMPIRWAAAVHPGNLERLNGEEFELLVQSGASRFLLGAESAIKEELNMINKHIDRNMMLDLAHKCSQYGIAASFTFVTGYPGMPECNIGATLKFAEQLYEVDDRHEVKVHLYAPYPGTGLYDLALKYGFRPPQTLDEWSWYDYYTITTPWLGKEYELIVREFNEHHYPYLHGVGE